VGDYTAGAILSMAFGVLEPAVDGNVRRILCRLFAIDSDPGRSATQHFLRELAARLLPATGVGDFNQGLMQFGAVLCTSRRPQCTDCPLTGLCETQRLGLQDELPRRAPRRPVPHYDVAAAVIWGDDGQVLIAKRNRGDMLGGMWEFPGGRREPGESLASCLQREIREELGLAITVGEPVLSLRHAYSHFRITLHVFHCRPEDGVPEALGCADWRWVQLDELSQFAFPVTDQKIVAALRRACA
jgi:A/G-specific adenine glycosylase